MWLELLPEKLRRALSTAPEDHWKAWGEKDPYFGVLSADVYRTATMDDDGRAQFFASGQRQIDRVLGTLRARFDAKFSPSRALDFGCGVGRTTIPLARRSGEAVGIDVSTAMLAEAAANAEAAGVSNVSWVASDDGLTRLTGSFDLVHSTLVFLHIRPETGYRILTRLLSLLRPGGMIAVQVLYGIDVPPAVRAARWAQARIPGVHTLVNLARRRPLETPNMEGNVYDLRRLLGLFADAGVRETLVEPARFENSEFVTLYARKPDPTG